MVWKLRKFLLLIAIVLLPAANGPAQPPTDEITEQKVIIDAVKAAIDRNDYNALNKMAIEFRQTRSRTSSGIWKLSVFHWRVLAELGPRGEGQCDDRSTSFFQDWFAKTPNEPAP